MTRAPAALPSWTAPLPTPPAAACTSSVSPGLQARPPVQPEPPGLVRDVERRRLGIVECRRRGHRARRVHEGVLGERAVRQHRTADHPVPGGETGHARAAATPHRTARRRGRTAAAGGPGRCPGTSARRGSSPRPRAPAPGAGRGRAPGAAPRPVQVRLPARRTGYLPGFHPAPSSSIRRCSRDMPRSHRSVSVARRT